MARPFNKTIKFSESAKINKALVQWDTMRRGVMKMTEAELEKAIEVERANKNRESFIRRMTQRLISLKHQRTKKELGGD